MDVWTWALSKQEANSIADSLLCFRVEWEDETQPKSAVQRLLYHVQSHVQKLGDCNIENLVTAVTSQGATQTGCCLVTKYDIGDEYPHVVYVKIWRWPDACKEELENSDTCKFGYNLNKNWLCVNPYHYNRTRSIPSVGDKPICDFSGNQSGIVTRTEANLNNIVTDEIS